MKTFLIKARQINVSTSLLDPTAALAGGGELAVADGPAGLVAGRDKVA